MSTEDAPVTLAERQESFGNPGFYGRLRFLAQVRNMFLLCEGEDGLYVLDQHAADERRNFERLRRGFRERSVAVQQLLVPEVVELLPNEVALFTEHEGELAGMGLEVRAVGPHSVAVHGVPRILARARPERLVRDLLAEVGRVGGRSFQGAIDLSLATMACHGSVRAGDTMSAEEAQALLKALDDVDFAGHCPHGRPVVMRLPFGELERRVGR
jgi:DNA mismatch repair protein MutL